jgi:glycine dehydrogenase
MTAERYQPYDFANRRHIGPSPEEIAQMLETVGAASLDALIDETVPKGIRLAQPLDFGRALSERGALDRLRETANKNRVVQSLIGQGYHGTIMPPAIQRNILENPAWYTAYTPYQPEISQGRLEALLNFQTLVCDLTGLDVANASLLDEATAAAEAMALAKRVAKSKANAFFVDENALPQSIAVLKTRAEPLGWRVVVGDPFKDLVAEELFGALFQYPDVTGAFHDFSELAAMLRAAGAIGVFAADPLALTLLKPPGEMGADVAVGSMQRFGVPMGYGGPHAAYIAVKDAYKRALPGRLVGVSVDARGNRAYRLSLQTREQHIRRETATSNICTAQPRTQRSQGDRGTRASEGRAARGRARIPRLQDRAAAVFRHDHRGGRSLSRAYHQERRRQRRQSAQGRPRPDRDHRRRTHAADDPRSRVARLWRLRSRLSRRASCRLPAQGAAAPVRLPHASRVSQESRGK